MTTAMTTTNGAAQPRSPETTAASTRAETGTTTAELRVVKVTSKIAQQPGFRRFVLRVIEVTGFPGTQPIELLDEITAYIEAPNLFVLLGVDGKKPRALFVGMLPASAAMMAPQALLVYSDHPKLSRLFAEPVRAWLKAAGHDRILGMNLHHKDAPFLRVFGHGGRGKVIGSVVEFAI